MNKTQEFSLWPAIDLMDGKPVRLTRGAFERKTEYGVSFNDILKAFHEFASGIHVIDLDGARDGRVRNGAAVRSIVEQSRLPVQLGGGIRSLDDACTWLEMGVERIIIGTKALLDPELLKQCAEIYGASRIVISVDVLDGDIMTDGWAESHKSDIVAFIDARITDGYRNFMVTDIARDGTLSGASTDLYQKLATIFPTINLLAAGGVGSLEDIKAIQSTGASGAIFGKAFYEGQISTNQLAAFAKC